MRSRIVVGTLAAACAAVALQVHVGAQQPARPAGGATITGERGYPTAEEYANSKPAQEHVARAKAIAGTDAKLMARFNNACGPLGPQRPALETQNAGGKPPAPKVMQPVKIFDNMWYYGYDTIGAWAIQTSQGIIMVDALNTVDDAANIIEPGLKQSGLDPNNVKYVLVGHGHFDHFGGTPYFQENYSSRIALSQADWELLERPTTNPNQASRPKPKRDMIIKDGDKVTLGDTTVTLYVTPGHTMGSLSYIIPVKYKGQTINALLLSGANITPNRLALDAFKKALDAAKAAGVQVLLNGHPGLFGDEIGWMEQIQKNPNGPNEFVYTKEQFGKFIDIMKECAESRIVAMGL